MNTFLTYSINNVTISTFMLICSGKYLSFIPHFRTIRRSLLHLALACQSTCGLTASVHFHISTMIPCYIATRCYHRRCQLTRTRRDSLTIVFHLLDERMLFFLFSVKGCKFGNDVNINCLYYSETRKEENNFILQMSPTDTWEIIIFIKFPLALSL